MLVAGVDDAGRGAVIGPLVIAGILLHESDLPKLVALKVKDSKLLSPRRRERFVEEIEKVALKHHIVELSPAEIDKVVSRGKKYHKLNRLEASGMAEVILNLRPDIAFVDASDVVADRFREHILEGIPFRVEVISEHKADRNYPVVSAASILAKVRRDMAIANLTKQYGDIGSGYASDDRTMRFLERWITEHDSYPEFVRKSWKPAKRLKDRLSQTRLL
ncbi:MAG: ribonuclease HII [Candidatus Bathyarchaeia archaeon]